MKKINNFIGNRIIPPCDEVYLNGVNPATGEVFYELANSNEKDVELAVEAALKAKATWQKMGVERRAKLLFSLAALIEKNKETLATLECLDTGKPYSLALAVDIPRSVENFRFFAKAISQFSQQAYDSDRKAINYTLNSPLGMVACIAPWNLPLYLLTWKIAPALAAGNCVVAKPSELSALTANCLAELCFEAGFPTGVLNFLYGEGERVGEALCQHEKIQAISFTGGTQTGKRIASLAANSLKKVTLELGGKNAAMIFEDCDFDKTINETVRSSFSNQGQICLATSRLFIEKSIYKKFKAAFVKRVQNIKLGEPLEDTTECGAVISQAHLQKIVLMVEEAKEKGAKVLCGGEQTTVNGKGFYYLPTVLEDAGNKEVINQQEVFGPVVCLIPFDNEKSLIEEVNDSKYGLAATIWSESVSRIHRIASKIEVGIVWVNCWMLRDLRTPFGGVKQSGLGREGGFDALEFFTEKKNVCIAY